MNQNAYLFVCHCYLLTQFKECLSYWQYNPTFNDDFVSFDSINNSTEVRIEKNKKCYHSFLFSVEDTNDNNTKKVDIGC